MSSSTGTLGEATRATAQLTGAVLAWQPMQVVVQVAAGIVVVAIVYMIALWMLQRDKLVADINGVRLAAQEVTLLDGWANSSDVMTRSWSTINRDAFSYAPLQRSNNRRGGAQFSYSMWLLLNDTSPANVAGRTLLLRGTNRVYRWRNEAQDASRPPIVNTDVVVKCPRIRFGRTYDQIVVELNTLADPSAAITLNSTDGGADPTMRHNALKLIAGRWAMLTFTFEDNVAINDFQNGVIVRFFLNDTPYGTGRLPSAMRQNNGDLFILPGPAARPAAVADTAAGGGELRGARVGDVRYFNYALPALKVQQMYRAGPPRKAAKLSSGTEDEPLFLSEYNKLDVYNS